jgi:outer membrane protein OmpA-like peptidoglycan-associated protein
MRNFLIIVMCLTLVACYAPKVTKVPVGPCPACKAEPVPVVKVTPPPPPPPPPPVVKKKIDVLPFYFAFDKATLENQQEAIGRAIEYLKDDPAKTVELQGNCDNRGSEAYNMKLGQRRANTVKDILVKKGIDSKRLTTKSFGESKATGNHAKDRRVDIVVIK